MALSVEERAIKTAGGGSLNRSAQKTPQYRSRPQSVKYDMSADNIGHTELLDYSSMVERTERMKRRWLRVIDNKERMTIDTQRQLKAKYDKVLKTEKAKRKRREDDIDDHKILIDKRKEKMFLIQKRREHIQQEFEKALKDKDQHYKQKMQLMLENKRKQELEHQ